MFKITFLTSQLVLGLAVVTALFTNVQAQAAVPAPSPQVGSLKMIVAKSTFTNGSWSNFTTSNNSAFTNWNCISDGSFNNEKVLGIADYGDGISRNLWTSAPATTGSSASAYPLKRSVAQQFPTRNCSYYNVLAENLEGSGSAYTKEVVNPTTVEGLQVPFEYAAIPNFAPANKPVYAYQFRYEYNFTAANKATNSELFRSLTGLQADYDGVVYTYTYYTYKNAQGQFVPWEVPTKQNSLGGWLVYGIYNPANTTPAGKTYSFTKNGGAINVLPKDKITFSYDSGTQILSWNGEINVMNGCERVETSFVEPKFLVTMVTNSSEMHLEKLSLHAIMKAPVAGQMCTMSVTTTPISGSMTLNLNTYNGMTEDENLTRFFSSPDSFEIVYVDYAR